MKRKSKRHCPTCSHVLKRVAKFCPRCGTAAPLATAPMGSEQSPDQDSALEAKYKLVGCSAMTLLGVLVITASSLWGPAGGLIAFAIAVVIFSFLAMLRQRAT